MFDSPNLIKWFQIEKRDLPWRNTTRDTTSRNISSPYAVWVSEVMLQQTQVSVVIPYFERWMERFPDIKALANASIDEVIKQWEGLGYYSRARHLHEGAKKVLEDHGGIIPSSKEALQKIKGIGPYTIGAILSFAFQQKAAAVDGNVLRVLARYFSIEEEISQPKTIKAIRSLAEQLLPEEKPWIVSEALIELGALICTKKPKCSLCPLKSTCKAFLEEKALLLPIKKSRPPTTALIRTVALLQWENQLLVKRGEAGQLMHDLHEFPFIEGKVLSPEEMQSSVNTDWGLKATFLECLSIQKHSFTRYRVELFPMRFHVQEKKEVAGYFWIDCEALKELAFSSGHKRLFDSIHIT